jgi:dTMP kinase
MSGRFIVLEGIDGSGTTSQCARLTEALQARGEEVHATREPSDGEIGQITRAMLSRGDQVAPTTLALMFAADRLDHLTQEIEPALARGATVLCDRYLLSSWAYQSLDCELAWVRTINRHARWPDLTLLLDLPAETAWSRVEQRYARGEAAKERFDALETQCRLATCYRELAADPTLDGVHVVDASKTLAEVTAAVLALIE